ncbi:hypothetical protein CONPUDRAFT_85430 [Coniophora puteana RWD-64-598 SS2]|uniref:histidine kinase n=1 Tax=Coniophora puteana (strain RWD-64-598) TaxID=741705 RepID=A0A5M3M779_CONPW|nr:uncharacterized protein CONPUDRAFT_85430 [Coniophora puteana RWD-64-598 SS2]EIW75099.1 hypothetical protein CONPUDRAFT_85430 [Coniophora puteana RWD-64-598 SS2]
MVHLPRLTDSQPPTAAPLSVDDEIPSTPSEVAEELLALPAPVLAAGTLYGSGSRSNKKRIRTARIDGLKVHWARFIKRVGTESPSDSSAIVESSLGSSQRQHKPVTDEEEEDDGGEVDEIVVDRDWTEDMKSSFGPSEQALRDRSGDSRGAYGGGGTTTSGGGHESTALLEDGRLFQKLLIIIRWEVLPAIEKFFLVRFHDLKTEKRYRRENWFIKKSLALWSAAFYIVNWIIGATTIVSPELFDKIWVYGITPVLTFPLVLYVMYDFPRDRVVAYQVALGLATWCWAIYAFINMYLTGFTSNAHIYPLGGKTFLNTFFYTSAPQTIALFGLGMNRITALICVTSFFVFACGMILPFEPIWIRNLLTFLIYHIFLLFVHYMNESSERRLFILREQLKNQFKATQKAQINERKEADSKRRLTSYVFHEVRVPLNTALLAVQNMEASGAVMKTQEIEFMALEGSLVMMSKVLNDMLDFNRMDSGRFEILSKPYTFHAVLRSLFVPLRMATDARQLKLVTRLDPTIDQVAWRAAYEAAGEDPDAVDGLLAAEGERDGVVLGDAIRLRQIINNLASNACKFTRAGGQISVTTRLVFPAHPQPEPAAPRPEMPLSAPPGLDDDVDVDGGGGGGGGEGGDGEVVQEALFTPAEERDEPFTTALEVRERERAREQEREALAELARTKMQESRGGGGGGQGDAVMVRRRSMTRSKSKSSTSGAIHGRGAPAPPHGGPSGTAVHEGLGDQEGEKQATEASSSGRRQVKRVVVRIEVSDTGTGIPPREMARGKLFSAFNQTEQGRQQGGKGTGLGLALVRQIVKLSGGRLGVRSKVGQGSTFWVELPLGVGARVVDPPDSQDTTLVDHGHDAQVRDDHGSTNANGGGAVNPSVMKTLMDQGGLVELKLPSSARNSLEPNVLTRGIGELSSGTPCPVLPGAGSGSGPGDLAPPPPMLGRTSSEGASSSSSSGTSPTLVSSMWSTPSAAESPTRRSQDKDAPARSSPEFYATKIDAFPKSFSSALPKTFELAKTAPTRATVARRKGPSVVFDPPLVVLVVDDDKLTRTIMSRTLARLGCTVSTAENGEVALEMVVGKWVVDRMKERDQLTFDVLAGRRGRSVAAPESGSSPGSGSGGAEEAFMTPLAAPVQYDVIFLDNQMPVMSGIEAVSRLREMGRDDFVVGVTGNALIDDQRQYLEAGVDHVLTKPVFEPGLVKMLTTADERRRKIPALSGSNEGGAIPAVSKEVISEG